MANAPAHENISMKTNKNPTQPGIWLAHTEKPGGAEGGGAMGGHMISGGLSGGDSGGRGGENGGLGGEGIVQMSVMFGNW
jgi:hypothetical protein